MLKLRTFNSSHPMNKLIRRVDEQQDRERIAYEERVAAIKRTSEVIAAFANGDDRRNPTGKGPQQ